MTDLQRFYRSQPLAKPHTKRAKAKKARAEKTVKDAVRAACLLRDGSCRLRLSPFMWQTDRIASPQMTIECDGPSEWAHMHSRRRSKTRGMAPEVRHDTQHSLMLCRFHHQEYDAKRLLITALTRKGADGPLKFTRSRTSREGSLPKERR